MESNNGRNKQAHTRPNSSSDQEDEEEEEQLWHPEHLHHEVGYVELGSNFDASFSPQPSSSLEYERRVSPLDPNMSSAARYSPQPQYVAEASEASLSPSPGCIAGTSLAHPDSPVEGFPNSGSPPTLHSSLAGPSSSINVPISTNSCSASTSIASLGDALSSSSVHLNASLEQAASNFLEEQVVPGPSGLNGLHPSQGRVAVSCQSLESNHGFLGSAFHAGERNLQQRSNVSMVDAVSLNKREHSSLQSLSGCVSPIPGPSDLQNTSRLNKVPNSSLPGTSGTNSVKTNSQASSGDGSSSFHSRSSTNILSRSNSPMPGPSGLHVRISSALSNSDEDDDDEDDVGDNGNGEVKVCNGNTSKGGPQVKVSASNISGFEATSSDVHRQSNDLSPLGSPSTPADNYIVSSSTGHLDSIPPTPAEFDGNDVSVPNTPASADLGGAAIIDSTIDSTSGIILDPPGQSDTCDSDGDMDSAGDIEYPHVHFQENGEISTSEARIDSDDSQEMNLAMNPHSVFSDSRVTNTDEFSNNLSLNNIVSYSAVDQQNSSDIARSSDHSMGSHMLAGHSSVSVSQRNFMNANIAVPGPSRSLFSTLSQANIRQDSSGNGNRGSAFSLCQEPSAASMQGLVSGDRESGSQGRSSSDVRELLPSSQDFVCSGTRSGAEECNQQASSGNGGGVCSASPVNRNHTRHSLFASSHQFCHNSSSVSNKAFDTSSLKRIHLEESFTLGSNGHLTQDENSLSNEGSLVDNSLNMNSTIGDGILVRHNLDGNSLENEVSLSDPARLDTSTSSLEGAFVLGLPTQDMHEVISAASHMMDEDISLPGPSSRHTNNILTADHIMRSSSQQVDLVGLGSNHEDSNEGNALLMMVNTDTGPISSALRIDTTLSVEGDNSLGGSSGASLGGGSLDDANHLDTQQASPSSAQLDRPNQMEKFESMLDLACKEEKHGTLVSESKSDLEGSLNGVKKEQEFVSTDFWCGECDRVYRHECPHHQVQTITDKPILSRARASLPALYLAIKPITTNGEESQEYGVFARRSIPKRTKFGPLEGILFEGPNEDLPANSLIFSIEKQGTFTFLDTKDEGFSNWMRFVRKAETYLEQNCVVLQQGLFLFFLTTVNVTPRTELKVGYSKRYGIARGLKVLEPTKEELEVLEAENKCWECFECDKRFESSELLETHLEQHDKKNEEEKKRQKRSRKAKSDAGEEGGRKGSKKGKTSGDTQGGSERSSTSGSEEPAYQYCCFTCNLAFDNPPILKLHELAHVTSIENSEPDASLVSLLESRSCPQCFKIQESKEALIAHSVIHAKLRDGSSTQSKPFKCELCYKAFTNSERLKSHLVVHGNDSAKPLACQYCPRRFCNNSALMCHIKVHVEGNNLFDCPICRETFAAVMNLREHVHTHCVNGKYTCPSCQKVFPSYHKVRRHIRSCHPYEPHTCQECGKQVHSLLKLKEHMLSHSDKREFLCSICGKQFKRKDKLKEHVKRMHTDDREGKKQQKTSTCKFVPKVDPTDYEQFLYKCHTCHLGFRRRGMLVNHLAKRHPNISPNTVPELNQPILKETRYYYCQYCEKIYKSSSKRKQHIIKNHPGAELPPIVRGEKKGGERGPSYSQTVGSISTQAHPCPGCHKQYASRAKLIQHQRRVHFDLAVGEDDPPPGPDDASCEGSTSNGTTATAQVEDTRMILSSTAIASVPAVDDMDNLLTAQVLTPELSSALSGQLAGESILIDPSALRRTPRVLTLTRPSGESSEGNETSNEDLLTQAMGEIAPLGSEQYVRLIGPQGVGGQVVMGTGANNGQLVLSGSAAAPVLMNGTASQPTTLTLVNGESSSNPETVTISLPAGQIFSIVPSLPSSSSSSGASSSIDTVSCESSVNTLMATAPPRPSLGTDNQLGPVTSASSTPNCTSASHTITASLVTSEGNGMQQVVIGGQPSTSSVTQAGSSAWPATFTFSTNQ